jgi:DNA-directed RNA polymerase sigma subunit (sigma70/sigma32)
LSTEDVLTSEELYSREVRCIRPLTVEKEWEIIKQAREGNMAARTALIKSCLNYVGCIAAWHARYARHDDYLDLVGIGNKEVVERFDEALTKENPCGYLRGCAKYAIIYYCFNRSSLIPTPWVARKRFSVTSLDNPVYSSTLSQETAEAQEQLDYSYLYEVLEQLPKHFQDVLIKHYGLYGKPVESLYQMSRQMSTSVKGSKAYLIEYRALKLLREQLTKGGKYHPKSTDR